MSSEVPIGFRRVLARELPGWQADGLIDEAASQTLVRRYELDRIDDPHRGWFATAFAILGALAIGAGIVSFVAANWAWIPPFGRFAIVFGATIVAYGAGLVLRSRGRRALSEAAFTCGALGFGGSLALGAQQFNFALALWQLYALWAAGLVPLAYVLRSLPVATVALAVAAASLSLHAWDLIDSARTGSLLLVHLAVIALCAALLSRRLGVVWYRELALAVVALGVALAIVPWSLPSRSAALGGIAAVALAAGAAHSRTLRVTGIVFAFLGAAPSTSLYGDHTPDMAAPGPFQLVAIVLIAAAIAAAYLVHRRAMLAYVPVGAALAVAILLPHLGPIPPLAAVLIANALVLIAALTLIARGVALRSRAIFLSGTVVCAVFGFMRFAEYDHNLSAKALAFVLVGAAFIAAALLFGREQRTEPAHAA